MKKHKLDIQYEYDFALIGICCNEKEYRLCWSLNTQLGLELQKVENLFITNSEINFAEFSMFAFEKEAEFTAYYLLKNEGFRIKPTDINFLQQTSIPISEPLKEWLIPEEKQCDYLLMLKGEFLNSEKILSEILEINLVTTAYRIDTMKLKSKQNLLF
ncbi:MAG TPA: IPExxxVDY family protein [Bacteroidia bacterium]|nr:IPExxxVDY family protein [Bacteroidia bacterium]